MCILYILYLQEKLPIEQLMDRNVPDSEPVKPPALDDTPFTFVEDLKTLEVLATKLKSATEFAVSVLISYWCHKYINDCDDMIFRSIQYILSVCLSSCCLRVFGSCQHTYKFWLLSINFCTGAIVYIKYMVHCRCNVWIMLCSICPSYQPSNSNNFP